jgi:hypothetical protein
MSLPRAASRKRAKVAKSGFMCRNFQAFRLEQTRRQPSRNTLATAQAYQSPVDA